jgi:hypothetical protein
MLIMVPTYNMNYTRFKFSYVMEGSLIENDILRGISWWKNLIEGRYGYTWYIFSLVCVGVVGAAIIAAILIPLIRLCIRKHNKTTAFTSIENQ